MQLFARFVIRNRFFVLAGICLITCLLGYRAVQISRETDPFSLFPDEDPDVIFFKKTTDKYGYNFINIVALETEDIFTHEALAVLRVLTMSIEQIRGVRQVLSLTNVPDMRRAGETILVKPLIDPERIPEDSKELASLQKYVLNNRMLVGNLVSADGKAALISVSIDEDADKKEVAGRIKAVVAAAAPGSKVYFAGLSMVMEYMERLITTDMSRLLPFIVGVFFLMLFLSFLSLRCLLLTLGTVILAIVWVLGVMSILGMALSMFNAAVLMVITVMATISSVFVIVHYRKYEGKRHGPEIAEQVLVEVAAPVFISGVIIFFGFMSLRTASLSVFREFGVATAAGSFFAMMLSLTFIPAFLACLSFKPPRKFALCIWSNMLTERLLAGIGHVVLKKSTTVIIVAVIVSIVAAAEIPEVPWEADMMASFPKDSEPRSSERFLQKSFGGSQLVTVSFFAEDIREPAVLDQMALLEKRLRVLPHVHFPQSAVNLVTMLNRLINDQPGLPETPAGVANLWFLLERQASTEMMVASNYKEGIVQARIGASHPAVVRRTLVRIQRVLDETVKTDLVKVSLAAQSEHLRKVFLKQLADQITEKAALDIKFHTGRTFNAEEKLHEALLQVLLLAPQFGTFERQKLYDKLTVYFRSEESDLGVNPQYDIARVVSQITALDDLSESAFLNALKETLPAALWQQAPEALHHTAVMVYKIMENAILDWRHRQAVAYAMDIIAGEGKGPVKRRLYENKALLDDISSDLWALNNRFFTIDAKNYRLLTGSEPPPGARVRFDVRLSGWPLVNNRFTARLSSETVRSILLVLGVIFILVMIQMRSLKSSLTALTPIVFTLVLNFAIMGLLGIPLNYTTIMIACIAIGVGVNFTIHFITFYNGALHDGKSLQQALEETIKTKGSAMLINTLIIAFGFFVLSFSVMPPQRHLGMFIFLAMIFTTTATFTVLPAGMVKIKAMQAGPQ